MAKRATLNVPVRSTCMTFSRPFPTRQGLSPRPERWDLKCWRFSWHRPAAWECITLKRATQAFGFYRRQAKTRHRPQLSIRPEPQPSSLAQAATLQEALIGYTTSDDSTSPRQIAERNHRRLV